MKTILPIIMLFFFLDAFSQENQLITDLVRTNNTNIKQFGHAVTANLPGKIDMKSENIPAKTINSLASGTFGFAEIKATDYNFSFLIYPGWYWESSDEYTSFYVIEQKYNEFATYNAYFSLYVYRNSNTPLSAATSDLNVANMYNPTITQNKTETTFANQNAYWNAYSYTIGSMAFQLNTWSFSYLGITYQYRIFTSATDWNTNKELYLDMTNGFTLFPVSTNSIQIAKRPGFSVKTYPNPTNGKIAYESDVNLNSCTISNLSGQVLIHKIINDLYGEIDISGLSQGYYVLNFESNLGDKVQKIQMIK